jgi:hypothetical protein
LVFVATGVCIAVSWLRRGLVIGGFIHLMWILCLHPAFWPQLRGGMFLWNVANHL